MKKFKNQLVAMSFLVFVFGLSCEVHATSGVKKPPIAASAQPFSFIEWLESLIK